MSSPVVYPKLGETRCCGSQPPPLNNSRLTRLSFVDWVLLDANLRFLFTDPVLTNHLKDQADAVIGRSLIEFIHPDERESASRDFHVVIQQQAIHGSVTRYVDAVTVDATVKSRFMYSS